MESIEYQLVNIASNRGGGRDIFSHKKNAYLIDPYSEREIADAFIYVSDNYKRKKMIKDSQKLLKNYQLNDIVEQYFILYNKALN